MSLPRSSLTNPKTMRIFSDFFPSEVKVYISSRAVDFSWGPAAPHMTEPQAAWLLSETGRRPEEVFSLSQVHGARCFVLRSGETFTQNAMPEADAVVSDMPDLALAVRVADCLPVFLYDARHQCLGMIHAGRKGSQQEVTLKAVKVMQKTWGSEPSDLLVALGPGIRQCCYEGGEEFREVFPQAVLRKHERWFLDLVAVNQQQLLSSGIREEHIRDCGHCTCCRPEYFSYRREGIKAGRHLCLIIKAKPS